MNTIKTVLLAALLSAAAYGVYVGVTGAPPSFGPRRRARDWEENTDAVDVGAPSAPLVNLGDDAALTGAASVAPAPTAPIAPPGLSAPPTDASAINPLPSTMPTEPVQSAPERYSSSQGYPSSAAPPQAANAGLVSAGDPQAQPSQMAGAASGGETPAGYDAVAEQPVDSHADFDALMQSVQSLLERNRLADAHRELSEWYGEPHFTPEEDAQVTSLLDRLAGTVIYSREHLLERPYEVQPGDTLDKIADA
ncbi:MAG TPA: hypothetical protein VF278_01625, partial [Pirellulales bacterium]